MSIEEAIAQEWVFVHAVQRKCKSAGCLGVPYGWTLWVDGVRVQPAQEFKTVICKKCSDSMALQTSAEVSKLNADREARAKRHGKVAGRVAMALIPVPAVCFAVYLLLGLGDAWRPLIWGGLAVPVLAAIVWLIIRFGYQDQSVEEVVEQRFNEAYERAINAVLVRSNRQAEILRGDKPASLDLEDYVVTKPIHDRGSRTGWTLFKCWGIIDEPGGTRREEKTTTWIREQDTLHQDIGEWLNSDS